MAACEIAVRLQPRARANEIVGERDGVLLVRVTAPPVDGRANDALCRLIAKRARLGVSQRLGGTRRGHAREDPPRRRTRRRRIAPSARDPPTNIRTVSGGSPRSWSDQSAGGPAASAQAITARPALRLSQELVRNALPSRADASRSAARAQPSAPSVATPGRARAGTPREGASPRPSWSTAATGSAVPSMFTRGRQPLEPARKQPGALCRRAAARRAAAGSARRARRGTRRSRG